MKLTPEFPLFSGCPPIGPKKQVTVRTVSKYPKVNRIMTTSSKLANVSDVVTQATCLKQFMDQNYPHTLTTAKLALFNVKRPSKDGKHWYSIVLTSQRYIH